MSTRQKQKSNIFRGEWPLPSGYEGLTSEFTVAPCGIEDADLALTRLFKDEITPTVKTKKNESVAVTVRFSAGEKWSLSKLWKNDRDRSDAIVFPLISVWRKPELSQSDSEDIAGRGINQNTGRLTIARRLVEGGDALRQELLNRLALPNRKNAPSGSRSGELSGDPTVADGGLLVSDRTDNVTETISIPTPQFCTLNYEVTVWTQYISQMNSIVEQIVNSYSHVGARSWKIETGKGYWFVASVEDSVSGENSLEDESGRERLFSHIFSIKVPIYVLPTQGGKVAVRREVSCNQVDFSLDADSAIDPFDTMSDPNLGADDPTLPLDASTKPRRRDLRQTGELLTDAPESALSLDPAVSSLGRGVKPGRYQVISYVDRTSGKKIEKFIRVSSYNVSKGETSCDYDITSIDANSGIEVKYVTVK